MASAMPGWEARPTCHSCRNKTPLAAFTPSVMGFQAPTKPYGQPYALRKPPYMLSYKGYNSLRSTQQK